MKRKGSFAIPAIQPAWVVLGLLAFVLALFGGSSRPDVVQLVVLRPLAGILLVAAIFFITRDALAPVRTLLLCLIGLAVIMVVQLIPLPPGLWQSLPAREGLIEFGAALGVSDVWRPISLVPARTLNALASLVVPLAVLIAAAASRLPATALLGLVAAIGVADAIIGILQVLGAGGLYLYAITNVGAPVGLFANQNHSGVFSAMTLVIIVVLAMDRRTEFRGMGVRMAFFLSFLLVLIAALLSGSRAGLLMTFFALLASLAIAWLEISQRRTMRSPNYIPGTARWAPRIVLFGGAAVLLGLIAMFVAGDRVPGLSSLLEGGSFKDLRWEIAPVLGSMMATFAVFGAGFGSFEEAYHIFEPDQLMQSDYINQAHNDWAQIVIEGGLMAILLLCVVLAWISRSFLQLVNHNRTRVGTSVFWGAIFVMIMLFSLVDYPLRTPLFQGIAVLLLAAYALQRRAMKPTT